MNNLSVSDKNEKFWDELCGTQLAIKIGIKDSSSLSLKKFDNWYFDFYPYLHHHIPFDLLKNKDVLEVGLGYGSVAQKIAECGANYTGLDIAPGPVDMVNHRLNQEGLNGRAIQGSILKPSLQPESFDTILAIGSLHHTGDLQGALDQCFRLLRDGGQLIFMVYYAYSYRRWLRSPIATLRYFMREQKSIKGVVGFSSNKDRIAYDKNLSGDSAPHTDWISKESLSSLCSAFSSFDASIENIDRDPPFTLWKRKSLLSTSIPSRVGLDLYACAKK